MSGTDHLGEIVAAEDLRRRYGEGEAAVDALAGVTVSFPEQRFAAIMGPSGSGKSTLMHLLAGLDRPTSGSVRLAGVELTDLDDRDLTLLRRDRVGFIFQTFNLLPVLDAEENILLPLSIAGRSIDREWFDTLVQTVGIADRLKHRPAELSGGQQQRVAVARALVSRPSVVFADEPSGNLDSKATDDVLRLLRQAVDEFEQTVVMVTHDPHAASFADRLVVLADGRVVHDGEAVSTEQTLDLMKALGLMLRLVLRGFAQRKVRVALTAISIVLGVALMAGTYILTDTINNSFAAIFQTASKGHDVVVSPAEQLGREVRSQTSPVTQQMVEQVRRTPGVAQASGSIFSQGTFLDTRRKRLTSGFAPAFIASTVPARFESFTPVKGRFPATSSEVAIDEATAERSGLRIGRQMIVAGSATTGRYTIVGILRFGGGESFGGAGAALLLPAEAQRLLGQPGRFDQIDVAATPGVSPGTLRDRIRAELPATVDVRTGAEQADHNTSNLEHNLRGLRTFLLIFAYVALVVGCAFIIFNTFSITVAQRSREFGLLRTLGASRGQILRSVVYEGLLLGAIGAGLGLLAGIGVAPLLDQLFKAFGATLPDNGTVIETRTIVVSLLVGILVTLLAGLPPALRATRVPPIAAMREGVQIPPRPLPTRKALIIRFVLGLIVLGVLISVGAAGLGIALIVVWVLRGVRLMVRLRRGEERPQRRYRVVPALGHAIGRLVRWRGITGRLAEENAVRQPGRTLVTAAALTVGLALVAFVAILAASFKATINHAVDRSFAGNLIVENSQAENEQGIPPGVAKSVRDVAGVNEVTAIAFTLGRPVGTKSNETVTAVEPDSFGKAYKLEWKQGSDATLAALSDSRAIVTESFAKKRHLKVGSRFALLTPTGRRVPLTTIGIIKENAELLGSVTIDRALAATAFGQREDGVDFVTYAPGATDAQVQPRVDRLLAASYPQVRSRTAAQFKNDLAGQINNLLTLIYVLLALSVIVSLFGIVNTLILSIYERTREIGMMRAIGTSRRQIRQMIRYESVITALIGGVLGLVVGILGALATAIALSGEGYVQAWPVGTLIVLLFAAALAGVLAAALPARRAARLDMLRAITSE